MAEPAAAGKLTATLLHFARALRQAGLPIGTGDVLTAISALEAVGFERRSDVYWALHAVFVHRPDHHPLFDQAFTLFWRNPQILERAVGLILPKSKTGDTPEEPPVARRLAEQMATVPPDRPSEEPDRQEFDAAFSASASETLSSADFDQMSQAELAEAKRLMRGFRLDLAERPTRRDRPDPRGPRIDLRQTLRHSLRGGGDLLVLDHCRRRTIPPPLVVICDISGSMNRYSRIFLHFLHALTNDRDQVQVFLFGTRLSNITRHLKQRDVDRAVDQVEAAVDDWAGGTRITECLRDFNRLWSRRVLGRGAIVLFISDGLDRAGGDGLAPVMDRLHRSCARLIWLNPLLRWDGFEPKAGGMRAILPHVDELRPVHSLNSLADLAAALSTPPGRRGDAARIWKRPGPPHQGSRS